MKTNTFAFAMTLLFVLVTTTTVGQTATAPSGSGTTGDPYQIATLDNLYWVTQNSTSWNKHFLQTADIDASSDTSWDSNQGFSPIGTAGVNFTGVYDGGGHTISGLFISRSSANNLGMFGIAYYPDTVKNLGLTNVNITGGTNTGGLVASNSNGCTILNCYTTGSVNATYSNYIGGLVGYNNGSVVSNCFSTVNVSVNSASSNIGGLVGYSRGQSTINNCYATGSVNGGASYAGGLVGYNITNGASPVALISNSYSLGKVTGSSPTGALVGQNDAAVDSCFWNKDSSGTTGIGAGTTTGATGKTTVQMKDPATFTAAGWDTASWYMGDGINNGYAYLQWQYPGGIHLVTAVAPSTSGGSYLIASLDNLYWVSQNSSSWGSSFLQTADIDASQTSGWASGSGFTPIGKSGSYFSGTYNGNGHTISNLWISRGSTSAVGLFGFPKSGATIENLGVVNANIRGSGYVGALVGDNDGTVSNCYSTGSVSGSNLVGGLIGGIVSGSASNSYSTASVSGGSSVGGLVGYLLSASVSDCYSTGSVSGGSSTGGLIGSNSGSVSNSFWDTQTSGQSGGSGTGETTATMKTQSTFTGAGWDFANTWAIDPGVNNGYPALIWQSDFPAASPTITTNAASSVHFTSAMLNGTVNPFKGNTTVNFVYGTVSGSYPDTVAASQSPVNGWTGVSVSAQVSGLTTNQTYYFRAIATSSYGSSAGSEMSFTPTLPNVSPVSGSALLFNGSNNYVRTSLMNLGGSALTIEYWFKGTNAQSAIRQQASDYVVTPWSNPPIHILSNDGGTGAGLSAGASIYDGNWHHVAMTWQQNTTNGFKSYLDGVIVDQRTSSNTPIPNMNTNVYMGSYVGAGEFTAGTMDEIRIWNVARTTEEIRENMHRTLTGAETGLVAYWQLNEGSGTSANDTVGSYNGTLYNGPTWVTSKIPVGNGFSSSVFSVQGGPDTLGTVTVAVTDSFDTAVDLTATEILTPPDSLATGSSTMLGDRYWTVEAFGTPGTFSTNLTFTVPSSFTNGGAANPSSYTLYHRSANAVDAWSAVVSGASSVTPTTITFNGITSFSQFSIGTNDPLPVEISSFSARANRLNAELKWNTATESNSDGWEVERKAELGMVSGDWVKVGFVKGAGTSASPKQYSFVDRNLAAGTYSYRLKQIDRSGTFKYSAEVTVVVGTAPRVFALGQNYPNPFNPTTNLQFTLEHDGRVSLKVYDILGREVATILDGDMKAGVYQQVAFDGSRYASGIYFAVLQSGGKQLLKKMLMIK